MLWETALVIFIVIVSLLVNMGCFIGGYALAVRYQKRHVSQPLRDLIDADPYFDLEDINEMTLKAEEAAKNGYNDADFYLVVKVLDILEYRIAELETYLDEDKLGGSEPH